MPQEAAEKEQIRRRGEQDSAHAAQVVRPTNLYRFVVDRLNDPRIVQRIIAPGESFGFSLRRQVKDAVTLRCHHIEKTGSRIETGSKPIRRTVRAARDEPTITRRLCLRIVSPLNLVGYPLNPIPV